MGGIILVGYPATIPPRSTVQENIAPPWLIHAAFLHLCASVPHLWL